MDKPQRAVLLVNLGSPDSHNEEDVKIYLDEFLMDKRVIDVPWWLRSIIVKGFILPKRPKNSAEAYKSIWWEEGSPLIVISNRVQEKLQKKIDIPAALGMRYGNPSVKYSLDTLIDKYPNLKELLLIPFYPHYAMSSYESVVEKARDVIKNHFPQVDMHIFPPFFKDPRYLEALSEVIKRELPEDYDHLLFSYHGLPERHIKKSDPTKKHCLKVTDCCHIFSPAHSFCYRHQVIKTTEEIVSKLNIPSGKYSYSFQSRLGWDKWIEPYTDKEIIELAQSGVKKLCVVCPAFVSDCLETLEEIGIRAREDFLKAGGEEFKLIPCLNDDARWIETLSFWINNHKWE